MPNELQVGSVDEGVRLGTGGTKMKEEDTKLGIGKRVEFPSTKLRDCVTHTYRKKYRCS